MRSLRGQLRSWPNGDPSMATSCALRRLLSPRGRAPASGRRPATGHVPFPQGCAVGARSAARLQRAQFGGGCMPSAEGVGRIIARNIGPVAARVAPQAVGGAFRRVLEIAIDGRGALPSAKTAAGRHLQRHGGSVDDAIESLIDTHIRLASAQGFVTNVGGVAALPVAIPANMAGVAIVQIRMIAAIAHLRGYDLADNRVRTALVMCLMGGEEI